MTKCTVSYLHPAGMSSVALIASLVIGLLVLLDGPSWQGVVGFVTAAAVPHLARPFRLPWAPLLCPFTFVLANWAIV